MKIALLYKGIVALFIIPTLVLGKINSELTGKYTKDKTINKNYTVNLDATFKVDNSYGNIEVVTWNENRVEIEVTITVSGNNEDRVDKKLDQITVDFNSSPSFVSAKTRFNDSRSWWNWGNNNVNMKINYIIKLPITNNVDISNDYGNINLDKLEGHVKINCDYGKITTKELLADDNNINFDYTNNSYFEYIKSGKINADYSSYTIGTAKSLTIIADYTKSKIEIAEDISYNCDYGGITIIKVNNVTGNGDYLTTEIGDVYKNVDIKGDYGSLKINNMTDNAGNAFIESDYMKITIGYASNYSFNFDIDLEYASLRGENDLEITKQKIESGDKYYAGYHGNNNSGNLIKISSDYGSVTFNKN
jgi:hypothetical protein